MSIAIGNIRSKRQCFFYFTVPYCLILLSCSLRRSHNGATRAAARRDEANPRNSITFRKASTSEGRFCGENSTKSKDRDTIQKSEKTLDCLLCARKNAHVRYKRGKKSR